MNSLISQLHPYPFERLRVLFSEVTPNPNLKHISLGVGEPKHPTPEVIKQAYIDAINAPSCGLSHYPVTTGTPELRTAIASWIARRYGATIAPQREVLANNGSREALFAFSQVIVEHCDSTQEKPILIAPNPFYQIYEGAAILSGAEIYLVDQVAANNFQSKWSSIPESIWKRTKLLFVCSPNNPTGSTVSQQEWALLFEFSDRYGFVIAADECYSEIYSGAPPVGALEAAAKVGRTDFKNLMVFNSLSKRSNSPGMRSSFCAGDAELIKAFLLYRTYHGSAMSPVVQEASIAAWKDEAHVVDNRKKYEEKFALALPALQKVLKVDAPHAGFFLWVKVPENDEQFAKKLYEHYHVTVLPGSYLARSHGDSNPGEGYVRMALVAELDECMDAIDRIVKFVQDNY